MQIPHRWLSILEGCLLVALGLHILNSVGLLITGTAGVGMILMQLTDFSFAQLFFVLNIPFYLLAWRTLGPVFTFRTFISVSLLSALSELMSHYVEISMNPLLSGILGGLLVGFGLVILFRHNASLGGLTIFSVYLERRFNIHASKTTLVADVCIFIAAFMSLDISSLGYSLVAFLFLSSVVGRYHRPPKWAQMPVPDSGK
ncbi:YitT family protein [Marinomonas transparens]|uniref:YitT family protein n=1 Tax=Marinomonas transparens TaxID=2795388 RepID=A0A934JLU1_9GAMM|nr:YitT family protein [Marinomonas transparens]MBJ7536743.1 YitT family protein [Marinomonas transparens]